MLSAVQPPMSDRFIVHSIQEQYAKQFTTFKPDKKLRWLPHLGTVSMEVKLEDRTVSAEVTPLEAAVLEHFDEQRTFI